MTKQLAQAEAELPQLAGAVFACSEDALIAAQRQFFGAPCRKYYLLS